MKKGELKNRLRRRTADKLYDLARSTGRVPAHPHRVETPTPALDGTRRNRRPPAKLRAGRTPGQAIDQSDVVLVTAIECDPVTSLRFFHQEFAAHESLLAPAAARSRNTRPQRCSSLEGPNPDWLLNPDDAARPDGGGGFSLGTGSLWPAERPPEGAPPSVAQLNSGLFHLQRLDVVSQVADALLQLRFMAPAHGPVHIAPHGHFRGAVRRHVQVAYDRAVHVVGRVLAVVLFGQLGQVGGRGFERRRRRSIPLGVRSMASGALVHVHVLA